MTKYTSLCRKADLLFSSTCKPLTGTLQCRVGCCHCCTLSSVLPIEAIVLAGAIRNLDTDRLAKVSHRAAQKDMTYCPLLLDGCCTVYSARPIICRTHGAPLAYIDYAAETIEVSACPLNFPAGHSFDKEQLLFMDELNAALQHLNRECISHPGDDQIRISLREVVLKCDSLVFENFSL